VSDMLTKAKGTKWGVVTIFGAGAGLVAFDFIQFDNPVIQGAADAVGAAVGGGLALLGKWLFGKVTGEKPAVTPVDQPPSV
jgi:hypothetical protein